MGDTLNRGLRPARRGPLVLPLPGNVQQWKAMAMQRLGWESRTGLQTTTKAGLDDAAERVLDRGLRGQGPFAAATTAKLRKGAGDDFKTYHDLQTAFESAQDRPPEMVAELKAAAQAYVDHFNEHNARRQRDPDNIAKRDACLATIKDLHKFELAHETLALGDPPWDSATALKAASLKTSLALSMLPPGEQQAERLGEKSASPTFWVNQRNNRGGKDKTFLLKPAANAPMGGFPNLGEPAREMMAGRVADMLNGALGLQLQVPETQVVSIAHESLPDDVMQKLAQDKVLDLQDTYVGSVQQFEATEGNTKGMDSAGRAQLPTRPTQELAVLDIITLNTDRHGGNFLVKRDQGGAPSLVPINHGLSFPTRGAGYLLDQNISSNRNALLAMPASHEPFDPEVLRGLARLDPDVLAASMKRERQVLETAHPSTANTMSDESIELSRRSAMFLKRAAGRLTPAAVQLALGRHNAELFDPDLDMNTFDALAERIIATLEQGLDGIKEYFLMPQDMQERMKSDLAKAGWPVSGFSAGDSLLTNDPATAMRLWKSGAKAPDVTRDPRRRPLDLDDNTPRQIEALLRVFPDTKIPDGADAKREVLENWRDWLAMGGTPEKVVAALELSGVRSNHRKARMGKLADAVKYLKIADGISSSLANDTSDHDLADIRHTAAYLREIIPGLEPTARQNADRTLLGIEQAIAGGTMDGQAKARALNILKRMRDPLVDSVRARMLAKFDHVIGQEQDPNAKGVLEDQRGSLSEGNVVSGYAFLKQRFGNFADAA